MAKDYINFSGTGVGDPVTSITKGTVPENVQTMRITPSVNPTVRFLFHIYKIYRIYINSIHKATLFHRKQLRT